MTGAQNAALKSAINANPTWAAFPLVGDGPNDLAVELNKVASPAFWVWRTDVSRSDLYNTVSDLNPVTSWDWTTYKSQSVAEQGAWREMFMGDRVDFSKANVRDGAEKIHGLASNNNKHCLAIGRRLAKFAEKILATGAGTTTTPGVMGFEGNISAQDVFTARAS